MRKELVGSSLATATNKGVHPVSDVAEGPNWWLASDGKFYPPHEHPEYVAPPPPHLRVEAGGSGVRPERPQNARACPKCAENIPSAATICPHCASRLTPRRWVSTLLVIFGLLLLGTAIGLFWNHSLQAQNDAPINPTAVVNCTNTGTTCTIHPPVWMVPVSLAALTLGIIFLVIAFSLIRNRKKHERSLVVSDH